MSTSTRALGDAAALSRDIDPEDPRTDLDLGDPARAPAFVERAPEDGVLAFAWHSDLAGHDEQLQKKLLLGQGRRHDGHFVQNRGAGQEVTGVGARRVTRA